MGDFSVLSTVFHYGILSEKTASIQSIENEQVIPLE